MEFLTTYEIPYLHPLMVHFPLVLIMLGAGTSAVWLFRNTDTWKYATYWFMGLGLIFGIAAKQTGETLEHGMEGEQAVELMVHAHEQGADGLLIVNLLTVLVLAALWWANRNPRWAHLAKGFSARLVVTILAAICAVLVAYTAHLGGLMTWGVPVGS